MCKTESEPELEGEEIPREIPVIIVTSNFCQEEPPAFQDPTDEVGRRHLLSPPKTINLENPWRITNET